MYILFYPDTLTSLVVVFSMFVIIKNQINAQLRSGKAKQKIPSNMEVESILAICNFLFNVVHKI